MRRAVSCAFVLAVALTALSCDNGPEPTIPTPPPTVTESFSGDLNLNGAATHPFTASAAGLVTVTLTAINPAENNVVGLSMGTWDGVTCRIVLANDFAITSSTLNGSTSTAASLCVRLYDQGNLKNDSVAYTVQVQHP
jgi:hypothetical protein